MSKPKTIVQQHEANFETLGEAFKKGDVALVECTLKSTGEKVAVICAITKDEADDYHVTPFCMFFNDNPYELLEPPTLKDEPQELTTRPD